MSKPSWFRAVIPLALPAVVAIFVYPYLPVVQDHAYHQFADQRPWGGIPHVANVISNVPLVLIGGLGVWLLVGQRSLIRFNDPRERRSYVVLFLGVFLTGFGSTFYHLRPEDARLFWDRLPLTLVFMPFFSAMLAERIDVRLGTALLWPLLLIGVGSLAYWRVAGDLRPYILVQFLPLAAIPLMLVLCPGRYTRTADLAIVLGWYVAAKGGEQWDQAIFDALGHCLSGHTLKHLFSAAAAAWLLRMLVLRRPASAPRTHPQGKTAPVAVGGAGT